MGSQERNIEAELFIPIFLTDEIRKAVELAEYYEIDCFKVGEQANRLFQTVFYASCIASSTPIYDRPLRRVLPEVNKNLWRALKLVRRCGCTGILRHLNIITASDFLEIFHLLDVAIADLNWIVTVFEYSSSDQVSIAVGLPPMAAKKPILSLVWSFIASLHMGSFPNRVEAAKELGSFALENDNNKRIIVEEGGISPLLKLLKEGPSSDAQIAAALVLCTLATDQEAVRQIVGEQGIPIIVQVLNKSAMRVQVHVANLISIMAENNLVAREEFGRANTISLLVSLLSFEAFTRHNINLARSTRICSLSTIDEDSELSSSKQYDVEIENEHPDMKFMFRINYSKALCMLLRESTSNIKRIIKANGLFCLAKHIKGDNGEFHLNCLMSLMEIVKAAELDTDIWEAFTSNSDAVKAVVDRLLQVIDRGYSASFRIAANKSIGSLAPIFPENETRVINLLVQELEDNNIEIATEAIIALGKFACPNNNLSAQHSKAIVGLNGVPQLMTLVKVNEKSMLHGLILLCYLALHNECSFALEKAKVLSALEFASHSSVAKNPLLDELIPKAIYHLKYYQAGLKPGTYKTKYRKSEENVGLKIYMSMLGCSTF